MRRITSSESICFGSGICTRMPCTAWSALRRSTCSSSSACVVSAGSRTVTLCIPASSHALPFERTYTALAGSSPTRMTARPGFTPFAASFETRTATAARTRFAIARPSISSAGKVHGSGFPDQHDLDLPRILELRLDPARDLFGERRHPRIVHFLGRHDYTHFAPSLNSEDFFDTLVARGDLLESLESFDVGLECFASRAGTGARDRVGCLHEDGDLGLVRHIVVMCGDAVHDKGILAVTGRHLDAELDVGAFVLVGEDLADVVEQRSSPGHRDGEPELGGHESGEPGDFLRVIEDVLAVARAPPRPANELYQLGMESVHTALVGGGFTSLDYRGVDFGPRFVDD